MFFVYILAGLGLLLGLGGAETRQFEQQAAQEIRHQLQGQNARVDISTRASGLEAAEGKFKFVEIKASDFSTEGLPFHTEPDLSKRGRIQDLRVDFTDFKLRALHVQSIEADIPDCRFDLGLALKKRVFRLSQSGEGTGTVKIDDKDLAAFILAKYPEIHTVQVSVSAQSAHVWGDGEFLLLHASFDVIAQLSSPDGNTIDLEQAAITINGKPADSASREALLSALNPVVDLNRDLRLDGAMKISSISLNEGEIVAAGSVHIPSQK